jgi:hypothetical protein
LILFAHPPGDVTVARTARDAARTRPSKSAARIDCHQSEDRRDELGESSNVDA